MRKIKAALRLLLCSNYILIVEDKKTNYRNFDISMSTLEVKRNCLFLYNFLNETDAAVNEANKIINTQ